MPQTLQIYQSRWSMELRRPDGVERSDAEAFEMVAAAGFDGMALDLGASDMKTAMATETYFRQHDLGCMINAFPTTLEGLQPVLDMAKDFDASYVNIIGQVMPFTVPEGADVIRRWMDMADASGVPILIETHRNCITNDLFYMLQLMDLVPDMPICADLSHYIVDREFWFPLSDGDQEMIHRILREADSFQGRVAGREQVQLQLGFPQHQKWVSQFKDWWQAGFGYWRAKSGPNDRLIFLTELGPPEYAMTGPDGFELSDRWEESLLLKQWAEELWAKTA